MTVPLSLFARWPSDDVHRVADRSESEMSSCAHNSCYEPFSGDKGQLPEYLASIHE